MYLMSRYIRFAIASSVLFAVLCGLAHEIHVPAYSVSFLSTGHRHPGFYIMDINRHITAPFIREAIIGQQTDMTWSPDAQIIVFRAVQNITIDLYATDVSGTHISKVTGTGKNNHSPAFSPDGNWLAFTSERDGNPEIYVSDTACIYHSIRCADQDAIRLTTNLYSDDQAAWSADSQYIVFQSNRDGNLEIYRMKRDGSQQIRLTNATGPDLQPNWSPDGQSIAFISERDINAELYLMKSDGSDVRRVTQTSEFEFFPQWSPDGKHLLFQRIRAGSDYETYVMNIDTFDEQRLTTVRMSLQNPVWQS